MINDITLAIIKPNAVRTGKTGPILSMINEAGFRIIALKMIRITKQQAELFYEAHRGKPFYEGLVEFMSSGPLVTMILKHENAVEEFRKLIGNTDPSKAEPGTIRNIYGVSVQMNAIHGSDTPENAVREGNFFFSDTEKYS